MIGKSNTHLRDNTIWVAHHRQRQKHFDYKSKAKAFVLRLATRDELSWLKHLIQKRLKK